LVVLNFNSPRRVIMEEKINQKQVWGSIAMSWNQHRQKPLEEVKKFIEQAEGSILDIACGSGRHLIKSNITGCDFSYEMLKLAKKKSEKISVSDISYLPFKTNSFDNIIFAAALHCVENQEKPVAEAFRVLKPEGKIIITVWNKFQPGLFRENNITHRPWKVGDKIHMRYYKFVSAGKLKALLNKAGFNEIKISYSRDKNLLFSKNIIGHAVKLY